MQLLSPLLSTQYHFSHNPPANHYSRPIAQLCPRCIWLLILRRWRRHILKPTLNFYAKETVPEEHELHSNSKTSVRRNNPNQEQSTSMCICPIEYRIQVSDQKQNWPGESDGDGNPLHDAYNRGEGEDLNYRHEEGLPLSQEHTTTRTDEEQQT